MNLSRHAGRNGAHLFIEDVNGEIVKRASDRHASTVLKRRSQNIVTPDSSCNGGFGWAIHITERHTPAGYSAPLRKAFKRGSLATDREHSQTGGNSQLATGKLACDVMPEDHRQMYGRDFMLFAKYQQLLRSIHKCIWRTDQGGAAEKHRENIFRRGIEAQWKELQHAAARLKIVEFHHLQVMVHQR